MKAWGRSGAHPAVLAVRRPPGRCVSPSSGQGTPTTTEATSLPFKERTSATPAQGRHRLATPTPRRGRNARPDARRHGRAGPPTARGAPERRGLARAVRRPGARAARGLVTRTRPPRPDPSGGLRGRASQARDAGPVDGGRPRVGTGCRRQPPRCRRGAGPAFRRPPGLWPSSRRTGRASDRAGVKLHRARHLDPPDLAGVNGIPVTTVARAPVDLAPCCQSPNSRASSTKPRCGGSSTYGRSTPASSASRSRRAASAVDALWPEERLVVEVDGRETHATLRAFEEDRRRDAALQAAGYRVVRLTKRRLRSEAAWAPPELTNPLSASTPARPARPASRRSAAAPPAA